jgi:uncharacterized protein YbaP (TraB family)
MTRTSRSVIAFLTLVLAAPAVSSTVHTADRNFLWKATKGTGSLYLVGSVHLLTRDYYPLDPALDAAYNASDLLVEEIDLGEMMATENQMQMLIAGMLPSGQSLDKVVSAATMAAVARRLEALGMPVEPLKRFKPWMLSLTLLGWNGRKQDSKPSSASTGTSMIGRGPTTSRFRVSRRSRSRSRVSTR